LFPPDDERLSLETCRGRKINTYKKVKKVRKVGCKSRIVLLFLQSNKFKKKHPSIDLVVQYGFSVDLDGSI
jgi:hypothetical protein